MKFLSRVVWSEGMYLGPHQFQAQARYFEDSLSFASSALWFSDYGLTGCSLDDEALRNGTVSLVHARGLLPDGMAFHMPQHDAVPEAKPIGDIFPPTNDSVTVFLAIPERRPQGPNCWLPNVTGQVLERSRFIAETRSTHDENTGGDERPVQLGRKNFRLMLDVEPMDSMVSIPIARVRRDGAGHFIYDSDFVAPCLKISASERLMLLVGRLMEILEAKSVTLSKPAASASRPGADAIAAEYSSREIASFWLLHAVNSALAPLRHIWTSKRGHPEELFLELSRLAGALCTFALDSHPSVLPLYDHMRLGECFEALDRHIRAHLETIVPTNCLSIPLRQVADYFWEGEVQDSRCFGRSRWVLGIHANVGEAELISRTPQLVKVCSAKFVGELVKRAMAGLALTHLPVPPSAISASVETEYFGISKNAPFWDHVVQTRQVGLYVPGEFPGAELELLVVLEK